ncbi:MAG: aspartate--tRNA ligase [Bacillota bacterium]
MAEGERLDVMGDWRRSDYCGRLNAGDAGRRVTLMGWVSRRRDLGSLLFVMLRDRTGEIQVVFDERRQNPLWRRARSWRGEFVVAVRGELRERSPETVNPDSPTGSVEVIPDEVRLLNTSRNTPFYIEDGVDVDEAVRLKYRYLDLRRPEMQGALVLRSRANSVLRRFLEERGFCEVETPYLTRSTPEGARDYLVPSRVAPGEFYALPQSPQLFKQLLMLAGLDRYYQLVRCFRDEDPRANRQPEFTQLDLEMSFVGEEEIYSLVEHMLARLFSELWETEVSIPFPRMSYRRAMELYGSDSPDLRYGLQLQDLSPAVAGSGFRLFSGAVNGGGVVKGLVLPDMAGVSRSRLDRWEEQVKEWGARGLLWFAWDEDPEGGTAAVRSPVIKHLTDDEVRAMARAAGAGAGDLMLVVAGPRPDVNHVLGTLRIALARQLDLIPPGRHVEFVWVINPPLFEPDGDGGLTSVHHPFTAPLEEDVHLLETDPAAARAAAYDVVLNGEELASGSLRIHERRMQERIFEILGIGPQEQRERFGFFLDAFAYGLPPHGGIAFGMDRLVMLLAKKHTIREVIAFPKTTAARDLMTGAPSPVSADQLRQLHLRLEEES